MVETGIYPDFIVIDGNEGGTGAAPLEFMDHLGMPMREGVNFVHNALIGIKARDRIKIGASGKIATAFDMARAMAIGADWCNSARGFMFALGCIQSLSCHTDRCPTGVTTQDPTRNRALVVPHKIERVYNYHHATLHALSELLAAAGLEHPQQIRSIHFSQRSSTTEVLRSQNSIRRSVRANCSTAPTTRASPKPGRWRGRIRLRRRGEIDRHAVPAMVRRR